MLSEHDQSPNLSNLYIKMAIRICGWERVVLGDQGCFYVGGGG